MNTDNPASRLYQILKVARSMNGTARQRDVWQTALEMESSTDSRLLAKLGKVFALPEEIQMWLQQTYPGKNWANWKESLDKAFFNVHLNGQWESSAQHISDRAMTELDLISTLYETTGGVKPLTEEEILKFLEKISVIKQEVIDSEMPLEMKRTFMKYLNKILDALDNYQITGVTPIMEAVESAMGHAVVDSRYAASLKQTGAGEELVSFLGSLVDAVISVQGLPPVATPFIQFIKKKSD